jgi:hypothetical protein
MLKPIKLGGSKDTLAILGLAVPLWFCGPYLQWNTEIQLATGLAAAGSGIYLSRRWFRWKEQGNAHIRSKVKIKSDKPIMPVDFDVTPDHAVLFGYIVETGDPLWIPLLGGPYREIDPPNDHMLIAGMSGVGKTVATSTMMFQQIKAGGGVIFVDGKLDSDNLRTIWQMLRWAGREDDLIVINPGDPANSNRYNSILVGDADEVATRIMAMVPGGASNSAGEDFYRKSATQALTAIVAALQRGGYAYTPADLSLLLLSPTELEKLPNLPGIRGTPEGRNASLFINRFRVPNRNGGTMIDVQKVKDLFGGIGGRLGMLGSGKFGEVANTTKPDVVLYDAIRANKIVYLMLPTMGKEETASDFAKVFVGDYRTAVSWIQALPKRMRPNPSTLVFFDEPGSYISENWDRLFEQARSANQRFILSPQTKSNLEGVSEALWEKIVGNCNAKSFFKAGSQETAEYAADYIGTHLGIVRTLTESTSVSSSDTATDASPAASSAGGAGFAYGEREQEMYKIMPESIKGLGKGECILSWGGNETYHLRIPMITFTEEFVRWAGEPKLYAPEEPKRPRPYRADYGIYERLEQVVKADQEYIKSNAPSPKKKEEQGSGEDKSGDKPGKNAKNQNERQARAQRRTA